MCDPSDYCWMGIDYSKWINDDYDFSNYVYSDWTSLVYVVERTGNTLPLDNLLQWLCKNKHTFVLSNLFEKVKKKYNPRHTDKLGNTLFMNCINENMNDLAEKLIETNGEEIMPGHINNDGNTPLILACKKKFGDLATVLISKFGQKCMPLHKNNEKETALYWAYKNKLEKIYQQLIQFSLDSSVQYLFSDRYIEISKHMEEIAIKMLDKFYSTPEENPAEKMTEHEGA